MLLISHRGLGMGGGTGGGPVTTPFRPIPFHPRIPIGGPSLAKIPTEPKCPRTPQSHLTWRCSFIWERQRRDMGLLTHSSGACVYGRPELSVTHIPTCWAPLLTHQASTLAPSSPANYLSRSLRAVRSFPGLQQQCRQDSKSPGWERQCR